MSSTKFAALYVFDETFPVENILEKRITRMGLICFPFLVKIYLRIRSSNLTFEDTELKNCFSKIFNSCTIGFFIFFEIFKIQA
jgi:hypothetical protein